MSDRQQDGRRIAGRYHLQEPIGRGGMGIVWRAHDELLDREVAVKEVRYAAVLGDEVQLLNRRTMREARAAARFTHPNVIVVHDVIEEDDRPWIVMQLVHSRSLGQVIKQDGPLSPEKVAEIGLAVLDALKGAHDAGVLHRDVKPENVLLADDGRVVLTDFGIATLETETALTMTGLAGTPAFIAPERLKGLPARRESDLWSLGATLHAAVEGKAPHDRGMAMATMHAVLNDDPDPAPHAGALGPVIEGLLLKEPVQRLTHDEATRMLRRAIAQSHTESAPIAPSAAPPYNEDDTPTDPSLPVIAPMETGARLPPSAAPRPAPATPAVAPAVAPRPKEPEPPRPARPEPAVPRPAAVPTPAVPAPAAVSAAPAVPPTVPPTRTEVREHEPTAVSQKPQVRRAAPIIAVAAAVLAVAGVGGYLGLRSGPSTNQANPSSPPVATATAGPTAATSAPAVTPPDPTPSAEAEPSTDPEPTPEQTMPDGWKKHYDKDLDFTVGLPKGWDEYKRNGNQVFFRGPGASPNSFLLVERARKPGPDPLKDWKNQEPSARGNFGGYKLLGIEEVDYQKKAADWEFTWNTNSGKTRVRNRGFITDNGRGYALYWHTLNDNWKSDLSFFDGFAASFKPSK